MNPTIDVECSQCGCEFVAPVPANEADFYGECPDCGTEAHMSRDEIEKQLEETP